MAWSTGTSYTAASDWGATEANGVGLDLRTWGGNVDGGGFNLSNLGTLGFSWSVSLTQLAGIPSLLKTVSNGTALELFLGREAAAGGVGIWGTYVDTTSSGANARTYIGVFGDDVAGGTGIHIKKGGKVGINSNAPTASLQVVGLASYANNAAAAAAGLTAGAFYIVTGTNPAQLAIVT